MPMPWHAFAVWQRISRVAFTHRQQRKGADKIEGRQDKDG